MIKTVKKIEQLSRWPSSRKCVCVCPAKCEIQICFVMKPEPASDCNYGKEVIWWLGAYGMAAYMTTMQISVK